MSNLGWQCPVCGVGVAPHVETCPKCDKNAQIGEIAPNKPILPYTTTSTETATITIGAPFVDRQSAEIASVIFRKIFTGVDQ